MDTLVNGRRAYQVLTTGAYLGVRLLLAESHHVWRRHEKRWPKRSVVCLARPPSRALGSLSGSIRSVDLPVILSIAAIVVGTVVPVVISRRENQRREMTFVYDVESLLAANATDVGLTVTYNGRTVLDPHDLTIATKSIGRGDITTAMFDAGKPLVFTSTASLVAVLDTPDAAPISALDLVREGESNSMSLRPTLIRKGDRGLCRLLVEGRPELLVVSPLIETGMVTRKERARRRARSNRIVSFGVFAVIAGVTVLLFQLVPAATVVGQFAVAGWAGAALAAVGSIVRASRSAAAEIDQEASAVQL